MATHNPKIPTRIASLAALAFGKYAPQLHRYIERRVRDPAAAPDLTQDIFERFLQIDDTDAVRNPQAYLFGIASHVVREAQFREDRSLVTYDSDAVDEVEQTLEHAWPDDMSQRLSLQQDLRLALAQLPALHRAVLLLVKREGFSYEEVAQQTQLTVSTVTSYLFEARAKVKMLLRHR